MAFLSTLAGIGGGPIGVTIMTRIMRIPHVIAVHTIQVKTAIYAASARGRSCPRAIILLVVAARTAWGAFL
jgi:uncharacterized membrane protein YfcA